MEEVKLNSNCVNAKIVAHILQDKGVLSGHVYGEYI